jgi:Ca-activated chloride channel family protein
MNASLKDKIVAQEKTMLSPVLLGLKASKAHALGWDTADPTWKDISDAAKAGKFTFGMTNPASSNTGLTATIGLAAALAKNPDGLTEADLKNPGLADFFRAETLTAGSSGWLAEAYERDQARVDGMINYESVLLSMNASGRLSEPFTLVYPKEGIVTADYPLMLLNRSRRADYDRLIEYLRGREFQTRMSAATLRRPVNPDAPIAPAIPKRTLVELPFPGQVALIDALLDSFLSDVRIPGSSRYILDLSGSMAGPRLRMLKEAMQMLSSSSAESTHRFARFQNREEVGILTFSDEPAPTRIFETGSTPDENASARAGITQLVDSLDTGGGTAIYSSLRQALEELATERSGNREKRYYTAVLMTDGDNNRGLKAAEFRDWYLSQGDRVRGIRVFPILFGEGSPAELNSIADLTGGRLFDSKSKSLAAVFKEIRGYQ